MITLLKHLLWQLLFDELAAVRWLRGIGGFLAGLAMTILPILLPADGWATLQTWGAREWLGRLIAATLAALPMMITAGQRNQSPEQIAEIARVAVEPPKASA
jgi:hypothetical protein